MSISSMANDNKNSVLRSSHTFSSTVTAVFPPDSGASGGLTVTLKPFIRSFRGFVTTFHDGALSIDFK